MNLYIVFAILIFGFLITIHEFGHFITAKAFGVKVNEFSICMGPAIWKKQKGETLYAIRCIPIGGYCAMEGEDEDSGDPRAFTRAKWWKRLLILVAGSAMNFLAGLLILVCIFSFASGSVIAQPVISGFDAGNTIEGAEGLQVGDRIYKIDGERVYTAENISMLLNLFGGTTHDVVVIRDGEKVTLDDFSMEKQAFPTETGQELRYGMRLQQASRTLGNTLAYSWNTSVDFVRSVRLSFQMLFTGKAGIQDLSGPIGIVKVIADTGNQSGSVSAGVTNVLYLAAFIAVNLAVMNLLPIPALDGGRVFCLLVTTGIEAVTKKKVNPKIEGYVHAVGMVVLLAFMAFVAFQDVFKIIR